MRATNTKGKNQSNGAISPDVDIASDACCVRVVDDGRQDVVILNMVGRAHEVKMDEQD